MLNRNEKILIVGLGLLGGSYAEALTDAGFEVGAIDTRKEAIVQKGMDRLMEGRTVFVIAHRLSTIRNAKAIMVLEKGEIIERGDHVDLLEQKGRYYQLYTLQYNKDLLKSKQ